MSKLLTVEDVNGALFRFMGSSYVHVIDTSVFRDAEFNDVYLDFAVCSHTINGDNHTYSFKIDNNQWTGGYYFLNLDDEYINVTANYDDGVLSVTVTENVKLCLYCTDTTFDFNFMKLNEIPVDSSSVLVSRDKIGTSIDIEMLELTDGSIITVPLNNIQEGVNHISSVFYLLVYLHKTDLQFNIDSTVLVGKVNKVKLNVPEAYKPDGVLAGDEVIGIDVFYNDEYIKGYWDSFNNDYYFDLDLTNKSTDTDVRLTLEVVENKYINRTSVDLILNTEYVSVYNYSDFYNEVIVEGTEIIQLQDDFQLPARININHDLFVYGNDKSIDLNNQGFNIINESVFKAKDCSFNVGNTAIIQSVNTKVELEKVTFNNCYSDQYNNLGSVIYCDVNLESLSIDDDFTTILNECSFINNTNCILHGGSLTVRGCTFRNTDINYIDSTNPAFLYQTDGFANITESVFDINYSESVDYNIGFAQALVEIGETAFVNTANKEYILAGNSLPFVESDYRNITNIFANYYYPQLKENVTINGDTDKGYCYCVSSSDWVFKTNCTVVRSG